MKMRNLRKAITVFLVTVMVSAILASVASASIVTTQSNGSLTLWGRDRVVTTRQTITLLDGNNGNRNVGTLFLTETTTIFARGGSSTVRAYSFSNNLMVYSPSIRNFYEIRGASSSNASWTVTPRPSVANWHFASAGNSISLNRIQARNVEHTLAGAVVPKIGGLTTAEQWQTCLRGDSMSIRLQSGSTSRAVIHFG
jgi:hypothetical protein